MWWLGVATNEKRRSRRSAVVAELGITDWRGRGSARVAGLIVVRVMRPSFTEAPNIILPSFPIMNSVDPSPTTTLRIGFAVSLTAEVAARWVWTEETSQERSCWDFAEGGDGAKLRGDGDTDGERDAANDEEFEGAGAYIPGSEGVIGGGWINGVWRFR
ncbi:hypothetical protein U1Q18_021317 [Sarracenia purpurea var. burkii]